MKLIYAGTPPFAARALDALLGAGHQVMLVLTQPDRAAGRGLKARFSAVKQLALDHGLELAQPATLRDSEVARRLSGLGADAMVVAAYGLLIPEPVLALPRLGCINIHASLLPRWRGAAPIQRAILAGDTTTGISIMQMDKGLDTGPVLMQQVLTIEAADTAATLHDKLAELGSRLIVQVLADMPRPAPQNEAYATYAAKIEKQEAVLDWADDAYALERKVRAFDPVPGAVTRLRNEPLKVWRARPEAGNDDAPGTVIESGPNGILVACGNGRLRITELQRAGGKRLPAAAFLAGASLPSGTQLGR